MAGLTTEELAQLKLMKETISEMHGEVNDMDNFEVSDIKIWLGYTWTKIAVVLAKHGIEVMGDRPTLPRDDIPF